LMLRYFMTRPVPWEVRGGLATALVLAISSGMELSLAKFVGSSVLTFLVFALCLKAFYPVVDRWIGREAHQ
jgi:hypothetical protein